MRGAAKPVGCLVLLGLWLGLAPSAAADRVVPSDRVRSCVIVRAKPSAGSRDVARLDVGEQARLLESVPGWHRIELPGAVRGYVSASWTRVVKDEPAAPPPAPPELPPPRRPGVLSRMAQALGRIFGRQAPIDLEVTQPATPHSVLRHPEARLPVSGFAATGDTGRVELMLAIDASTSANEYASADVDGDGVLEDRWAGDDSIYQAQIRAARELLAALRRLPGNSAGERVRVGVVTFSGDDTLFRDPADRDFELAPLPILALANRDARLVVPLRHDYAAVDHALVELAARRPRGMTDIAAAIGRSLVELEGLAVVGAADRPREGALRVIDLLTDGMPSLPYAREQAERAARYAARLASDAGIRVNVFELGRNTVTRKPSETGQRMARVGHGSFVHVERPGDVVDVLSSTSLAFVDRVRLSNRTTGKRTRYVSTGVDGSFYGEVPLQEGENRIDVTAVLLDGRERTTELTVDYHQGLSTPELEAHLAALRERNAALIEDIRKRLALEIDRERQDRRIDVSAGPKEH